MDIRERDAERAEARYHVSIWHGSVGSIAEVRDRKHPDRCLARYSTIRDGETFLEDAQRQTDALNRADAKRRAKASK